MQRCFYGFYYVTEEDLKFFNRNCEGVYTKIQLSSLRLLRVARYI